MRDETPEHGEENPAWEILPVARTNHALAKDEYSQNNNGDSHHTPEYFGFIEINKKLDKSKAEPVLESVEKDEDLDGKNNIFEPKFTWFGVQILEANVAKNLAKHGNPFGGPHVQTRSGKKNKLRNWKGQGRGNTPAWFEDSVFIQ